MKRKCTSVFIALFLFLVSIDTVPLEFSWLNRIRDAVDPVYDLGIWQGRWSLFSPNVDKQNNWIEVQAVINEGETITWRSPDWTQLNCAQKFARSREIEFYDRIRNSNNSAVWDDFANYSKRQIESELTGEGRVESWKLVSVIEPIAGPFEKEEVQQRRYVFWDSAEREQ